MSAEETQRPDEAAPMSEAFDGKRATAAIVTRKGEHTALYPMFVATAVTPAGAFLEGSLFLEVNEIVSIELRFEDGVTVQVIARVVALERGDIPGMMVAFTDLDEHTRALIHARAQGVSEP